MADTLVIVDSPAKKDFFDAYYSGAAEVYVSEVPVAQPTHSGNGSGLGGVDFTFTVAKGAEEAADKLAEYRDKNIIVALDSDPRSEYFCWLISSYVHQLTKGSNIVKRLSLSGVDAEEVKEAFDYVTVVDDQRGLNFYTRSLFDGFLAKHLVRLVGTSRGPGNFPLQYNSLSCMFLLAEREMEIKQFRPKLKWQVKAELSLNGQFFQARLEEAYDMTTDGFFRDGKQARWIKDLIDDDPFVVDGIKRTPLAIQPPSPYMLTEILHDALVIHGIGPRDVLEGLRKLFHGVDVGGKITGVISSFSTLENANTSGWLKNLQEEVVSRFGQDALGDVVVEPVTGMIFPLRPQLAAEQISGLDPSEAQVYELIRCRALASRMKAAVGENFKVEISAGPEAFFGMKFRSVSEKGFLRVYLGRYDKGLLEENLLTAMKEEDVLNLIKVIPEQTGGTPAEHYTIKTLFTDLADFSISADLVNVSLLQAMINAGYIVIDKEGYLKLGENSIQVTSILNKAFPHMQGINLSAYIEQTIAEATSGRKDLEFALKQFDQALTLQGRSLVKAKLPTNLKPRTRRSSTIIKQVEEEVSAPIVEQESRASEQIHSESSAEAEQKVDESVEAVERETVVQDPVESVEEVAGSRESDEVAINEDASQVIENDSSAPSEEATAELDDGASVEEDDGVLAGDQQPELEAEEVPVEAIVESPFLAEEEDEWPDELKNAFEAALNETSSEETASQAGAEVAVPDQSGEKNIETDEEHACQVCGKAMLLKEDRFGKFWSCSGFPGCRHTEAFSKDGQGMYCPICREGKIINKRTPSGKPFYVCMDAECEFMSWAKPHYVGCPLCDMQYLVEKKSSSGKNVLCCPKAGCDYSQSFEGGASVADEAPKPKKRKVRVRRKAGSKPIGSKSGGKKVRVVRRKKK